MKKLAFTTAAAIALIVFASSAGTANAQVVVSTPGFYGYYGSPYGVGVATPYAGVGVATPYVGVGVGGYYGGPRYYGGYYGGYGRAYYGGFGRAFYGGYRGGFRGRR